MILFIFLKKDILDSLLSNIFSMIISELSTIYLEIAFICSLLKGYLKLSIKIKKKDLFKSFLKKLLIFISKILS